MEGSEGGDDSGNSRANTTHSTHLAMEYKGKMPSSLTLLFDSSRVIKREPHFSLTKQLYSPLMKTKPDTADIMGAASSCRMKGT